MKIYISMPNAEIFNTFLTSRALERLNEVGTVTRTTLDRQPTADELVEEAQDADVILCGWETVLFTKELTDRLPNLKIIAYTGGSMADVVEYEVLENGIIALTGNYIFAQSVAEGCLSYVLCALRRLEPYMKLMREGAWRPNPWLNNGLFGKKVGLVGFGEIAKNFLALIKPFNVEVLVNSGHMTEEEADMYGVTRASKEEIFSTCDIVSIHLAQTEKTIGIIDRSLLSLLKPDALFVNTARGKVVDESALIELLSENRFRAALDVFETEPLPKDNPLRNMENVLLLPHIGGPTIDMREYIVRSFADDFVAFEQGKPMKNQFAMSDLGHMSNDQPKKDNK